MTTTTNIIPENKHEIGERAKRIPRPVAIPFPPLKRLYMGYWCPNKANIPTIPARASAVSVDDPNIYWAKATGMYPFRASATRVITPHLRPTSRATFVAPMFPLPTLVISNRITARLIMTPKGIEPRRYAPIKRIMITVHMPLNSWQG